MNPRQRRGVLFMVVAVALAAFTFVGVTGYVRDVRADVGDRVTVFRAAGTIDPYVPLTAADLEPFEMPARWAPPTSVRDAGQLLGRRIPFAVRGGTILTDDMLVPPSDLSPTEREIAINVSAVTGIGGRVRPGDRVDIYAVFGSVDGLAPQVRVLVRNVRVVSVGGEQSVSALDEETGLALERDVLAVTLALEPDDALAVTYANAFADEVRLVGLPTGDTLRRDGEADVFDARDLGGTAEDRS